MLVVSPCSIAAGEVVAVLGPNVAGKTTSIGVMLGLPRADFGTARLFQRDPRDRRARSRRGVMLQESASSSSASGSEITSLPTRRRPSRTWCPWALAVDTDRATRQLGKVTSVIWLGGYALVFFAFTLYAYRRDETSKFPRQSRQ